ncbi:MAG TPA: hypothetical protein VGP72_27570 [Planctomycetota bacterium]
MGQGDPATAWPNGNRAPDDRRPNDDDNAASGTFLRPEKIGMNSRLARRLAANGMATIHGTLPRNAWTNTKPKLATITG